LLFSPEGRGDGAVGALDAVDAVDAVGSQAAVQKRVRRTASWAVAGAALALLAAPGAGARALEGAPGRDYWLLTEFDWGDDRETVIDSLEIAPGFICYDSGAEICRFVRVQVDGEELLARFDYRDERLWQVRFVTPELTRRQARDHMSRVVERLAGYVERLRGPPTLAGAPPSPDSLSAGSPTPTHFWKLPDMEIRIEVGRQREGFYAGASFYDPQAPSEAD
jgi:hypothetical protein